MKYGITLPNMGIGSDVRLLVDLAREAESAGWDGAFVWDALYIPMDDPVERATCDPWIALAAMAISTERLRLGTLVTPLSRRRPWKVARETATLDRLTNGRFILPVGLGALDDGGFGRVGDVTDRRARAEMLDESLEILNGLWSGEPFSFSGKHYHMEEMSFLPTPVQSPRVPVWVVGAWPRKKSMQRVLRWDGVIPAKMPVGGEPGEMTPEDIRAMKSFIDEQRTQTTPFDIVYEDHHPSDDAERAAEKIVPYAEAGLTWWLSGVWNLTGLDAMRARIRQGPPRVA